MKETIKLSATLVLGVVVGIIIGYFGTNLFCLTWKNEVGIDTLINPLSAVVIAIFLSQAYQKHLASSRIEKDILIAQINESIKYLREIRNDFRSAFVSHSISTDIAIKINANLRQFSNSVSAAKDLMEVLNLKQFLKETEALIQEYFIYKQGITENGMTEQFTGEQNQKQENQYNKINMQLHRFVVRINRS